MNTQHADEYNGPADEWEIPRSKIIVGMEVSRGSYGQVFRGQLKLTARSPKIDAHRQEMEFEGKSCLTVAVKMLRSKLMNPFASAVMLGLHEWCSTHVCMSIYCYKEKSNFVVLIWWLEVLRKSVVFITHQCKL